MRRTGAPVHLVAGLNGAGKSTHARWLAHTRPPIRFALDEWMLRLYKIEYDDPRYHELREGCTDLIWEVAQQILFTGTTGGGADDCVSNHDSVASAPTWVDLKDAMLGYTDRGRVVSVRTEARGDDVGAGRS